MHVLFPSFHSTLHLCYLYYNTSFLCNYNVLPVMPHCFPALTHLGITMCFFQFPYVIIFSPHYNVMAFCPSHTSCIIISSCASVIDPRPSSHSQGRLWWRTRLNSFPSSSLPPPQWSLSAVALRASRRLAPPQDFIGEWWWAGDNQKRRLNSINFSPNLLQLPLERHSYVCSAVSQSEVSYHPHGLLWSLLMHGGNDGDGYRGIG